MIATMYSDPVTGHERLEYHVSLLTSLASAKRVQACILLSKQELDVGSLAKLLELSQSATSQHLSRLSRIGIVTCRADAQFRFYRCGHVGVLRLLDAIRIDGGSLVIDPNVRESQ